MIIENFHYTLGLIKKQTMEIKLGHDKLD